VTALAVSTTGLVRDYGRGAGLQGVDLRVPRRGVYGLVGPNGAGKTTLLSILAGLRRADAGRVRLEVDPDRIAVCPDAPEFEPWLTAAEAMRQSRGLAARGRGGRRAAQATNAAQAAQAADTSDEATARVLAEVGLAEAADRRTGGFSRGMAQRLGLAVALALDPELLILDEPTSALDPAGRAEMLAHVARLGRDRTVIFSSHVLADVQRVAGTVGVLDRGRLLFQGPVQDLIDEFLQPAWEIRVRGGADRLCGLLRRCGWVTSVTELDDDSVRVEAADTASGERGLPGVIAEAGVALVALRPLDADLEAAFLALTGGGTRHDADRAETA
jgi:ABC-2 type transport system ATP-binding protein